MIIDNSNQTSLIPLGGIGGGNDLSSTDLLGIAQAQGGQISQKANELVHPETSILATIGNGFKTAFKGFVDTISIPSEIVAGLVSPDFTVKEAIQEHKRVSDAVFGDTNIFGGDTPTLMQKIGNFIVRTPIDILTDPLTYLSFGASSGVLGLSSLPKITLGENAIKAAGLTESASKDFGVVSRALSDTGSDLYKYTKNVERQFAGTMSAENLARLEKTGNDLKQGLLDKGVTQDTIDFTENELKTLLSDTVEAKLRPDYAKKVLSNLLENNPALTETMLDKGGIKLFGKSILSSQRIQSVTDLIPGMTMLDNITSPIRNSVNALFDPAIVKTAEGFVRLPEEYVNFTKQLKDMGEALHVDTFQQLGNIQKELNLSKDEWTMVMDGLSTRLMPSDPRLAKAYTTMLNLNESSLDMLKKAGIPISTLENHTGLVFVPEDTRKFVRNSQFSQKVGAAQQATYTKFIEQGGQHVHEVVPAVKSLIESNPNSQLAKDILSARSVQDVGFTIGRHTDDRIQELTQGGMSFQDALNDPQVKELQAMRTQVDSIPQSSQMVGKAENLGISYKQSADEIKAITDELQQTWDKLGIKKQDFEKNIVQLSSAIQDIAHSRITGDMKGLMGDFLNKIPSGSRKNAEVLLKRIEDYVGRADINKMASTVKSKSTADVVEEISGKGVKELAKASAEKLVEKVLQEEKMMPIDVEELNKHIKQVLMEKQTVAFTKDGEKAAQTLSEEQSNKIAKLYSESGAAKYKVARTNLDENALTKMADILKTEYEANPVGVKNLLKQLTGNKSELADTIQEMKWASIDAAHRLKAIPKNLDSYFTDEGGKVFKRVAASASELERAGFKGFDTNLLTAFTTRQMQNVRQALGQNFMEGLIRNFGAKIDEAHPGWVPIDNASLFKKAEDIGMPLANEAGATHVFHPAIAKAYEDMLGGITKDQITEGFWKNFDKIQKYWKASVTSIFPMFHGRNAISNVFLNMMDLGYEAFNPATHGMAGSMIYFDRTANSLAKDMVGTGEKALQATQKFNDLMSKEMFTDKTGYTWTLGELRKVAKDNNIAFTPNITGSMDVADRSSLAKFYGLEGNTSNTKKVLEKLNPLDADRNFAIRGGREVGRAIEEQARMVNFITNLKNTGDVAHAAQRTKQFLFDYGNLTGFEKNVLRRLIPFYSFTKFNLQLQAKTLLHNPGRVAGEIRAATSLGDVMGGQQLTDKEKSLLPPWMANTIALKKTNSNGTTEVISGFGTPIEQPFQQFQPTSLLGSISPLIRYPVEAMTGYQFFRGKPTSEVIDASNYKNAPRAIQDFIGYTEYKGVTKDGKSYSRSVSLRPGNMNLLSNVPFAGRTINVLGQLTDANVSDGAKLLNSITGVNARSVDFNALQQQQERELQSQLETLLSNAGVRGSFTRYYNRKNTTQVQ